jgi:hypothetical protein
MDSISLSVCAPGKEPVNEIVASGVLACSNRCRMSTKCGVLVIGVVLWWSVGSAAVVIERPNRISSGFSAGHCQT